jgi:hypothetical protein
MKKILCFLLVLQWVGSVSAQQKFYVAANGSDANAGTLVKPLKTLNAALKKVANVGDNAVEIYLRGGRYASNEPIQITPQLLNGKSLLLSNYQQEKVTISGAVAVQAKWQSYKNGVFQAYIGKGLQIDQLLHNGKPLHMARYPDFDANARVFNGTAADAISKEKVKSWKDPAGGYVHALHQGEWGDFHYQIKRKIGDSLVLEGGWQNNRPAPMHKEYRFVENIFEELNAPGEWFYNRESGMLYCYPPKGIDINKFSVERSTVNDLIRMMGSAENPVEHVTISGINFTGTNRTFMLTIEPLLRSDWTIYRGGAILLEGTKNIAITGNTFTALGGHAIFVSKFNREIRINRNYIHHIGANAIAFVGDTAAVRSPSFRYEDFVPVDKIDMTPGPKSDNYPTNCTAADNLIHNIGQIEKQVAGVQISMAMDITISHNSIYNVPRSGINIGDGCWGGHMIEFNDVFNTVMETGDHGAFNSWGRDRFWLPGINDVNKLVDRYPVLPLLDVVKTITIRNNRFQCEHGWDIDLDDGSSNYHIYNNLCLNGGLKLREGFYRTVENNILVNNTFHPHVWYDNSMDIFRHNIVTTEYAPIRIPVWGKLVDSNFFIQKAGLIAAQKNNTDINSKTGDPAFINDDAGNFSVQETSPAKAVGFKNFPMDHFGVESASLIKLAKQPKITGVRTLDAGKKGLITEWLGASIKNIETLGEQSASGLPDKSGVLIIAVSKGSLAEKSGLEAGDVIRSINGKSVENVAEMLNAIQTVMWMGQAEADIIHNQQPKKLRVRLK